MRKHSFLANLVFVVALLLMGGASVRAEQNDFPLWPFDDGVQQDETFDGDLATHDDEPWMFRSRWADVGWPRVRLPRFRLFPRLAHEQRSYILGQNRPSALEFIVNTPQRMANRLRSMWNRSLDLLSFGTRDRGPDASRSDRRPLFGNLFGGDDQDHVPQTTNEWMEQDRITF